MKNKEDNKLMMEAYANRQINEDEQTEFKNMSEPSLSEQEYDRLWGLVHTKLSEIKDPNMEVFWDAVMNIIYNHESDILDNLGIIFDD